MSFPSELEDGGAWIWGNWNSLEARPASDQESILGCLGFAEQRKQIGRVLLGDPIS